MIFPKNFSISHLPFRMVVVLVGLLLASLQGWIRFVLSLSNWTIYESFGVLPGVWYLAATGLFSGIVYLAAATAILFPLKKFKEISTSFLLVGLAGYWIDRIFVTISPEARTSLPFAILSSTGLTIAAIGILYWDTIFGKVDKQEK